MKKYYYAENDNKYGPYSVEELKRFRIQRDTLVWHEGLDDWKPAHTIQDLSELFNQSPPPIQQSTPPPSQMGQAYNTPHPPQNHFQNQNVSNQQATYGSQQFGAQNQAQIPRANSGIMPKTWFVPSILATIFCCLPFGIIGIINATKVESLYKSGDIAGSIEASENAGKWTKYAVLTGLIVGVLYFVLTFAGILTSFSLA